MGAPLLSWRTYDKRVVKEGHSVLECRHWSRERRGWEAGGEVVGQTGEVPRVWGDRLFPG